MLIVVASGNIFRREFSSYVLGEAGYEIGEARSAEALISLLRANPPALILLDLQLESADPAATLRAVRLLSDAPIIWIAEPARLRPQLMVDTRPAGLVSWPFRGDELLAAVAVQLERAPAAPASLCERCAGSSE